MSRRPKTEKLSVNMSRRGELRYETAYTAPEAARIATKYAKQGWRVKVQSWQSLGTKRGVQMTCAPTSSTKTSKTYASCEIAPAFKKRLKTR